MAHKCGNSIWSQREGGVLPLFHPCWKAYSHVRYTMAFTRIHWNGFPLLLLVFEVTYLWWGMEMSGLVARWFGTYSLVHLSHDFFFRERFVNTWPSYYSLTMTLVISLSAVHKQKQSSSGNNTWTEVTHMVCMPSYRQHGFLIAVN